MATQAEPNYDLRIGCYTLRRAQRPDSITIQLADGPAAGEGGEFSERDLEQVIAQFYRENF